MFCLALTCAIVILDCMSTQHNRPELISASPLLMWSCLLRRWQLHLCLGCSWVHWPLQQRQHSGDVSSLLSCYCEQLLLGVVVVGFSCGRLRVWLSVRASGATCGTTCAQCTHKDI